MKFKKIVGFGDSWIYGDELLDPSLKAIHDDAHCSWAENKDYRQKNCFLGLLGQHYGVPTENYGLAGGSLQSMIWTFLWWLQHEPNPAECLVLCVLTDANRFSVYHPGFYGHGNPAPWNKFVHVTWVYGGSTVIEPEFQDLVKKHVALCNCEELDRYNYLQACLLFDGVAARQNIRLLQFHANVPPMPLSLPTQILPGFDLPSFFRDHPDNQQRELVHSGGHPNEQGHEIIRDILISEIDQG